MKVNIKSDKEKARSIRKIIKDRRKFVSTYGLKIYPTVICENYYEIIKELAVAIFLIKGKKFIGQYAHKELFEELSISFGFNDSLIYFLNDFRTRRNGSRYYGQPFDKSFLDNHLSKILEIIKKLDFFLDKELGVENE
jgi:hypothetical protein